MEPGATPRRRRPAPDHLGRALAALLAALTVLALKLLGRMPWVLVGWLWFLGMLVPVIGLVQVGIQSHADRYTYLPCLGPVIAVAWSVRALVRERPGLARAAATLAAREFGATGVLLGQVFRYRERRGEALGSSQPASVAYELTLYAAPQGRRLWSSRFDETQQALGANMLNLPRYPGRGTRWLTAAELARWGADAAAQALAANR